MNKLLKASERNLCWPYRALLQRSRVFGKELRLLGKEMFFLSRATSGSVLNGLSVFEFVVKFGGDVRGVFFLAELTLNRESFT